MISAAFPYEKQRVSALGQTMAYVDVGAGDPIVFLHGNFCRTWPVQREVTVPGAHFLQEDAPDEIGQAVASWLAGIRRAD